MRKGGWIGVDLDGTLAHYDHWRGADHIGEPIQPMLTRVQTWLAEGKNVKIFTARMTEPHRDGIDVRRRIQDWCEEHGLPRLEVTNVKDYWMVEVWDDRAVQVIMNTGEPVLKPETA